MSRKTWIGLGAGLVLVLVATGVAGVVAVRHLVRDREFPSSWLTFSDRVSPAGTAGAMRDVADATLLELDHLGSHHARARIHGDTIDIGAGPDDSDGLIALMGRSMRPTVSLRRLMAGEPVPTRIEPGTECDEYDIAGPGQPYFGSDTVCGDGNTIIGATTGAYLDGSDIVDARAKPDGTGWAVAVTLNATGSRQYATAISDRGEYGTLLWTVKYTTVAWAVTTMLNGHAMTADGTVTGLDQVEAQRLAALFRVSRRH